MLRPFRHPPSSRHSGPQTSGCWVVATLGLSFLRRYGRSPACHRVRLWQGGPASTYCHFRLLVLLFTDTSFPRDRLLALPEFRKGPWPLQRVEGRWQWRSLRSLALPSCYDVRQTLSLCSLCSDIPTSSQPQPLGKCRRTTLPAKTQGTTLDCPFNFAPPRVAETCRCQVCNRTAVAPVATGPPVAL